MKRIMESHNDGMAGEVKDAIECLTTIPTESLSVRVRDGWVYLAGPLKDQHQKEFVGELVQRLPGVQGVTNLITVEPDPASRN